MSLFFVNDNSTNYEKIITFTAQFENYKTENIPLLWLFQEKIFLKRWEELRL